MDNTERIEKNIINGFFDTRLLSRTIILDLKLADRCQQQCSTTNLASVS